MQLVAVRIKRMHEGTVLDTVRESHAIRPHPLHQLFEMHHAVVDHEVLRARREGLRALPEDTPLQVAVTVRFGIAVIEHGAVFVHGHA